MNHSQCEFHIENYEIDIDHEIDMIIIIFNIIMMSDSDSVI